MLRKNKIAFVVTIFIGLATALALGFNNCSKSSFSTPSGTSDLASAEAGIYLLDLLEEAKRIEAKLNEQGDVPAVAQAAELRKFIDNIEKLISSTGSNLPVDHKNVLDQRDYLVNAMAKGRELLLAINFQLEIDRLDREDAKLRADINALDIRLTSSISDLEIRIKQQITNITVDIQTQITNIKNEYTASYEAFQTQVENRFNAMNTRITALEERVTNIESSINQLNMMIMQLQGEVNSLRTTTVTAIAALKSSLEDLKTNTESQIAKLMEMNNTLNKNLIAQQNAFENYIKAQTQITSIQARMCKLDVATGLVAAGENVCADQDAVDAGNCCLTVNTVNCSMMFPEDNAVSEEARNQCSNVLITIKNHEVLVKELAENEAEQNKLIEKLVADVQNLNDNMALIQEGMAKLQSVVESIENKMTVMDARLILVELKAARGEAVATLQERSDLYLAWIARRTMDVKTRFCDSNSEIAYNKSDYESAKHNWVYCQERLKWLTEAHELIQLAKAYGSGVLSANLDQTCSLVVSGKGVEAMTPSELLNTNVSQQVLTTCKSGPAFVLTLIGNIVKLQNRVGPDFRTAEYMATKAKIGQMIYFGGLVSQAGTAAVQAFENVDPTTDVLKDTYFGRIERVFKNQYVKMRLRTSNGQYPLDPSKFAGSVAGLNLVYSEAEIKGAANPYLARLKNLEIEESCSGNCGFKVVARNDVKNIGSRFSFPKDSVIKCPIVDETVMVKSSDDKHYGYSLNYTRYKGATEELLPRLQYSNNNHNPVAASTAKAQIGEFAACGYRVRHIVDRFGILDALLRGRHVLRYGKPYAKSHGLPQCQRFHFACHLWSGENNQGEWIAPNPNANILHYLSGLDENRVLNKCKESGASYVVKTRALDKVETDKIYVYKSNLNTDGISINYRNAVNSTTTQLTKDYWMLQDVGIDYGVGNVKVSQAHPFFAGAGSTSEHFLRGVASMTSYAPVQVQQCFDPL